MMIQMMRNARGRSESHGHDEAGMALVAVVALGAVLAILVTAGVAYSLGGVNRARDDQDWNGALAAAYAGVEEYQSRLVAAPAYVRYGEAAAEYTTPAGRPDLQSIVTLPPVVNPAFGIGASGTWATVTNSTAQFRYEVNNSKYDTDGSVTLRATGRVGQETRSIVADLKQSGFVEYVYFTDKETTDRYNPTSDCSTRYAWGNPARPSGCSIITFASGDVIDGDVHSNDRIVMCSTTFAGKVTTEAPALANGSFVTITSGCTPDFQKGVPTRSSHIEMPPNNSEMKNETRYDLTTTDVPDPGCLYTGPTSIVFNDNGTMTVKSPWTKFTQISGSPATEGRNPQAGATYVCGNPTDLRTTGATVAVPDNNLIFVQNVPAYRPTGVQDPNYSATEPSGVTCIRYYTGPNNNKVWHEVTNGVGYPVSGEATPTFLNDVTAYGCKVGDLFVKGTLDGKVTLAAQNNIYVVGDLKYEDVEDDVLGLVGNNAVIVWNPVKTSNGDCLVCNSGRTIHAAILSVEHTFTVQNVQTEDADIGNRGTLSVLGSIAQNFRGVVRSSGNGYEKSYRYDTRFKYTAPPKFLAPASTTYGVTTWSEVNPAFNGDGTYSG